MSIQSRAIPIVGLPGGQAHLAPLLHGSNAVIHSSYHVLRLPITYRTDHTQDLADSYKEAGLTKGYYSHE